MDFKKQNPYHPPAAERDGQADETDDAKKVRSKQRDRVLAAVLASFGAMGAAVHAYQKFVKPEFLNSEITYTLFAYGFFACTIAVLVIYRDKKVEPSSLAASAGSGDWAGDDSIAMPSSRMNRHTVKTIAVLAASCLTLFGIVSWAFFVGEGSDDQDAVSLGWLVSSVLVGFFGVVLNSDHLVQRVRAVFIAANLSITVVVMTRVIMDCLQDPTEHNLWPFEVLFACIIVTFGAGIGASIGAGSVAFTRIVEGGNNEEH